MKEFIPKTMFDLESTDKLKHLFKPLSSEEVTCLLEWMQDMHWPVSHPISNYFYTRVGTIHQELEVVFQGQDNEWKWNLMKFLILGNPNFRANEKLLTIFHRIRDNPTPDEKVEELDELCREYLSSVT